MGVNFKDKVFIDSGIQQLGVSYIRTTDASATGIDITTSAPAPSSYIMIMVEATGAVRVGVEGTIPFKSAWNFYTYFYDIGNYQNLAKEGGLVANGIYSSGGYMHIVANLPYRGDMSATFEIYATAGNGYRYPIDILSYTLYTP